MEPLLRVHSRRLSRLPAHRPRPVACGGREGDAFPYTFPVVGRRPLNLTGSMRCSASSASTPRRRSPKAPGRRPIGRRRPRLPRPMRRSAGERAAFALCRPPGHHCGARLSRRLFLPEQRRHRGRACDRCGQEARGDPRRRLSPRQRHAGHLLRPRRRSLRLDPRRPGDGLSLLLGPRRRDRSGEGEGATLNLPLPRGTDWSGYEPALQKALERIGQHEPELLIVSYGADTYESDPISHFKLKTGDYAPMARRIAVARPTHRRGDGRRLCGRGARRERRRVPQRFLSGATANGIEQSDASRNELAYPPRPARVGTCLVSSRACKPNHRIPSVGWRSGYGNWRSSRFHR